MKNEKGITLIALVITIIVMLILIGVTINIAINGGLFETAQNASKQTQIETDREILSAAVLSAYDPVEGKIVYSNIVLPDGWTGSNGTYTNTKTNNTFTVAEDGKITYSGETGGSGEQDPVIAYFNSTDNPVELIVFGPTGITFKDNEVLPDAHNIILGGSCSIGNVDYAYLSYDNKGYRFVTDNEKGEMNITKEYTKTGREGEIVKLDADNDGTEEDWIVFYDNGSTLELLSKEVSTTQLTLGASDTGATGSTITSLEDTDLKNAISSYNSAITRINNFCKDLIDDSVVSDSNVRSVGSNKSNPNAENTTLYTFDHIGETQISSSIYSGVGKSEDSNYLEDFERMCYLGIMGNDSYWLASREIRERDPGNGLRLEFDIRSIASRGFNTSSVWDVNEEGIASTGFSLYGTHPVRPVITVSSSDV